MARRFSALRNQLKSDGFDFKIKNPKTQLFFIGDSYTLGIGTTGTTGTNTVPFVSGDVTFPKQTVARINNLNVTPIYLGFSGRTARWFIDNQLSATIAQFDFSTYEEVICVVEFGVNETNTIGTTTASILQDFIDLHTALKNAGAKTIVVPIPNTQSGTKTTVNDLRNSVNKILFTNYLSFADEIANLQNQQSVFGDLAPYNNIYFKDNDPDGFSRLHITDAGALLYAEEIAQAFLRLTGIKLPYSSAAPLPTPVQPNVIQRLVRLDFPFKTGLTTGSNTDTLTPVVTTGTAFGATGTANYKIVSGQDGYVQYRVLDGSCVFAILGFRTTYSTNASYGSFQAGIFNTNPNGSIGRMSVWDKSLSAGVGAVATVSNSIILANGDYLRLIRVNGTIKAQHCPTALNGVVWSDLYIFTGTFTGDIFINVDVRNDGKMLEPKIFNGTLV